MNAENETRDIAQSADVTIPGDWGVPHTVRTAIEYVAHTAAKHCKLRNGQTALFWHLLSVVSQHVRSPEADP